VHGGWRDMGWREREKEREKKRERESERGGRVN